MAGIKQELQDVVRLGGLRASDLARRVFSEVRRDNCSGYAAQLAYYFLFSLFPFLLFLTALLGYLPIPDLMDRIMELFATVIPRTAMDLVRENIQSIVTNRRGGLLSLGILAALWSSSSAITAVTDALNRAYDVQESRPFWKVRGVAILLLSVFLIVSMALLVFGPQLGAWIAGRVGLGGLFELAWNILRWPVILIFLTTAMAALYYFAPDVEQ